MLTYILRPIKRKIKLTAAVLQRLFVGRLPRQYSRMNLRRRSSWKPRLMGGHRDELVRFERGANIAISVLCQSTGSRSLNAKVCLQHMLPCRSRLSCFLSSIATLMASGYGCCPSSSLPARMGRKDVTAKTYIQTRLVDHFDICIHLTTHLRFTWSSLTKKCIQYPAIDRQLWARSGS